MANLVQPIKKILAEKAALEQEYKAKMAGYDIALSALKTANTVCLTCEGTGKILKGANLAEETVDPQDPNSWVPCPACHGTGGVITERKMNNPAEELLHSNQRGGIKLGDLEFR